MAYVMEVRPDDGSPVLDYSNFLRAPSFCGSLALDDGVVQNIPNFVPGSDIVVIPQSVGFYNIFNQDTNVTQSIDVNQATGQIVAHKFPDADHTGCNVNIFQMLPVGNGSYGFAISNSTDFIQIGDTSRLMRPIWKFNGVLNGEITVPIVAGYPDTSKYVVYAWWDNSQVVVRGRLAYDSSFINLIWHVGAYADVNRIYNDPPLHPGSTNMNLVVFYPAGPQQESASGINIYNAAGQCTFSSYTAPFIYSGYVTISEAWQNPVNVDPSRPIARPMVPLLETGIRIKKTGQDIDFFGKAWRSNGAQFQTGEFYHDWARESWAIGEVTMIYPGPVVVIDAAHYM